MSIYGPRACSPGGASSDLYEAIDLSGYATKDYVVSALRSVRRPIITVWAERKGHLGKNVYQFSFGSGSRGDDHRYCGYTMMTHGYILCMGVTSVDSAGGPSDATHVKLVIDGRDTLYGIEKHPGQRSAKTVLPRPLEVSAGSTVNFISKKTNATATSTVVSALIELDI